MPGRKFDLVRFNAEAFSYDLAERGLNREMFCDRIGKSKSWISNIINRKTVDRSTVEEVEKFMLAEKGKYIIEIPKEDQTDDATPVTVQSAPNPEIGYIRTNMNSHFHEVETRLSAVEKAIREIPSTEDKIDQVLSKMNQQIILMNRMLELWGYKKGVQNETGISKS